MLATLAPVITTNALLEALKRDGMFIYLPTLFGFTPVDHPVLGQSDLRYNKETGKFTVASTETLEISEAEAEKLIYNKVVSSNEKGL
jgi:hypothetical protein